ncbi:esterase/lipase family protein [Patescibacteria group bacterium]
MEAVDAIIMLGRIIRLKNLRREMHPAIAMFSDSFDQMPENEQNGNFDKTIIFMPGFFAKRIYYSRFFEYFYRKGISIVSPQGLVRNTISWNQAHKVISRTIKKIEDATGEIPILIGHSKGGVDVIGVLPKHSEIAEAFLIATPLRGSSLGALELLYGTDNRTFDKSLLKDADILSKITAVVSRADCIVPPREGIVPGAKREITIKSRNGKGSQWDTHTGLPYHARRQIFQCITK